MAVRMLLLKYVAFINLRSFYVLLTVHHSIIFVNKPN